MGKQGSLAGTYHCIPRGCQHTPVWRMLKSFGCVQTFLEIYLRAMYTVIKRSTVRVVGAEVHNENIAPSFTSPWHPWHICATLPHSWLCFDLTRRANSSFIDRSHSFFLGIGHNYPLATYLTIYVSKGCDDPIFSGEADGVTEG